MGLSWTHDTVFLPTLDGEAVLRATSTLMSMTNEAWVVTSVIDPGAQDRVEGKRTLHLSPTTGTVMKGEFEGSTLVRTRVADTTVRFRGRIERIAEVSAPETTHVDAALTALGDDDPATRIQATRSLVNAGGAAHVLAVAALRDNDRGVRDAAALALRRVATEAAIAVAEFLRDTNARERDDLLTTVRAVATGGARATPANLAGAVRAAPCGGALAMGLVPIARARAGRRELHPDVCAVLSCRARPLVRHGLHLRDPEAVAFAARGLALHAVGALPPSPSWEAPAPIVALLKHGDPAVVWCAVRMVDLLGARGDETRSALRPLAQGERPLPTAVAIVGTPHTDEIDTKEQVRTLVARLPKAGGSVAREHVPAVAALGRLGADARPALDAVQRVLEGLHRTGRPSVAALRVADALCRIDRPTGHRIGLFTVSLRPIPEKATKQERRVYLARARRAAASLAYFADEIRSPKMRKQLATRAIEALQSFTDPLVTTDLLRVLRAVAPFAPFVAKDLTPNLKAVEGDWQQTLTLDGGRAEDADLASLLLAFGEDVSRELRLRHGLVRVLRAAGGKDATAALTWLLGQSSDPWLRVEAAQALRAVR